MYNCVLKTTFVFSCANEFETYIESIIENQKNEKGYSDNIGFCICR